jgi:hypothetical protein
VRARQTASTDPAAAERSRVPAFPEANSFFGPACRHAASVSCNRSRGLSKDRGNVTKQSASQRACQRIGTSSDCGSRALMTENALELLCTRLSQILLKNRAAENPAVAPDNRE